MGIIACLSGLHEWGVKKRRLNGEIKEIKVCTNCGLEKRKKGKQEEK